MAQVMTVFELAEYIKVHPSTIYRMLKHNPEIPAFKVGSDWRFDRDAIDRWLLSDASKRTH